MDWITPDLLKCHGFRRKKNRHGEFTLVRSVHSPLGDPQFLELVDETNGIFSITRYADSEDTTLSDALYLDISSEDELAAVLNILGNP